MGITPDDTGGAIVLRESGSRWTWTLIGSLAVAALGGALALAPSAGPVFVVTGIVIVLVFAACAIVSIGQLRRPGALTITDQDVEVLHHGKTTRYALADCGAFAAWRYPRKSTTWVVFDYAPDPDTELHRANREIMGGSRSLTADYGLPAEALAKLLNEARAGRLPS